MRRPKPLFLRDLPEFAQAHLARDHVAEEMLVLLYAERHEIAARLGVVVTGNPDAPAMARIHAADRIRRADEPHS